MLILLLAEIDTISEEKYCKKNIVKFFYSNCSEKVFIFLTKVVIGYIVINSINVRKYTLRRYLQGPFVATVLVFIIA